MSPIIYTPHECETPPVDMPVGSLWQCPECDKVWALDSDVGADRIIHLWLTEASPRRDAALRSANDRTTPTVTPHMVQLALETYWNHVDLRRDAEGEYTECAECGTGSYDFHTIMEHACEKAVEAVQDALRGETHG